MTPKEKITDTELNAYLDGELSGKERVSVEERLATDGASARKASELTRISDAIRSRYSAALDEPLPDEMELLLAGVRGAGRSSRALPWYAMTAAAVLLLAGGAAGFFARGILDRNPVLTAELVGSALNAHSVYVGEVRHPVEVQASEEAHLVKWLTKRLGADVRAPVLSKNGYTLLGGRLLPNTQGPAAQFMYENKQGKRLTLYVRAAGRSENTAFQFASQRGLSAFFWIDRPLAYAIVGEVPRDELLKIARITYEQLS